MEFNLTEAFKQQYELFLQEEAEKEFSESFDILEKGQKQYLDSLNILESYMALFEADEVVDKTTPTAEDRKEKKSLDDTSNKILDTLKMLVKDNDAIKVNLYNPVSGYQEVTRISEMKFPQNIIFFITQLISWIKNLVLAFIDKFSSSIRLLLGIDKERRESRFSEDDLKLKLNSVKTISTEYMYNPADQKDKKTVLYQIPANEFTQYTALNAGYEYVSEAVATDEVVEQQPKINVISVDTSKELLDLQQTLDHFISLYKNAYGSNDEWMFGTDDLELMMNIFKQTYKSIKTGEVPTYDVGGTLTEIDTIDKDRLRENLIRTNTNTENLKKAYLETSKKIENIGAIVGHKQLIAAKGMGVQFAFLSAATYEVMIKLTKAVKAYLIDAEKNNKKLERMRNQYAKISDELGKLRTAMQGISGVAYTSIYQRRIDNLFMASRYMTQTVTLRLTTLGLYIKELKDIRALITNLNSVNLVNKKNNPFFKNI